MNSDSAQNPHEEREARITALLLGELAPEEAASLRRTIEQDAELASLYKRLKQTIRLVGEAAASPADEIASVASVPLKLDEERRQKLLAHFKTVAPMKFATQPRREWSWVVPLGAAAAILLLAAIAIPNFTRARTTGQANAVMNNLRMLDSAKQQWALENKKSGTDEPTLSDLTPYL